jgi:hypothetical protein
MTAVMRCVCAWCDRELPAVPCCEAQADKVTHGICPECAAKAFGQLVEVALP